MYGCAGCALHNSGCMYAGGGGAFILQSMCNMVAL